MELSSKKDLIIRGEAIVFIDWANVYNWRQSLKHEVNPAKLFSYLKGNEKIVDMRFYFGTDANPKSILFLKKVSKIGFTIVTKPVKYILVAEIENQKIYRRKCDFDMEMCIDAHKALRENIESFIFFTGDGDFEPLYKLLITLHKQVIVIYAHGHLGKEIYNISSGLYKRSVDKIDHIFE